MKRKRSQKTLLTIPDAIDAIKTFLIRQLDKFYSIIEHWSSKLNVWSWMEHIGSKMNVYAWNKRWKNRKNGTGYR